MRARIPFDRKDSVNVTSGGTVSSVIRSPSFTPSASEASVSSMFLQHFVVLLLTCLAWLCAADRPSGYWEWRRSAPSPGPYWPGQARPTASVVYYPNDRYPPDRLDPYRFGYTTDRYGRGFGYSCRDVFECQALKEKQEQQQLLEQRPPLPPLQAPLQPSSSRAFYRQDSTPVIRYPQSYPAPKYPVYW
ncbi:uncharacterized protein LOC135378252 [Ornithodoros turicata]|uniref:uncharacterized protein LOC135378252 n=1 Tax=Ornithodoros turicata TaxID=34597 RepID=UPI0031399225